MTGSDYNTASALVNQATPNNSFTSDSAMLVELNKLRTRLPNAVVSTYTYKPSIGVSSETDPTKKSTYYEYDGYQGSSAASKADVNGQSSNPAHVDPDKVNGFALGRSDRQTIPGGKGGHTKYKEGSGQQARDALSANGEGITDVGYIVNLNRMNPKDPIQGGVFGIDFDSSPNNKSGEITPPLAEKLGIDKNPNTGGMPENKLLIVIFPGSGKEFGGKTPTQSSINQIGGQHYQQNLELINNAINASQKVPRINNYD